MILWSRSLELRGQEKEGEEGCALPAHAEVVLRRLHLSVLPVCLLRRARCSIAWEKEVNPERSSDVRLSYTYR